MLCSIDGQARQLIFRVADNNNVSISRSHLTDSMTSLTSLSAVSSLNQTNKTEVLQHLAKAIAEERCLLDKVKSVLPSTRTHLSHSDLPDRKCRTGKWRIHSVVLHGFHEWQRYSVHPFNNECDDKWIELSWQRLTNVSLIVLLSLSSSITCLVVYTKRRIVSVERFPSVQSRRKIVWRKCSPPIVPYYIWMRRIIIISIAWNAWAFRLDKIRSRAREISLSRRRDLCIQFKNVSELLPRNSHPDRFASFRLNLCY